MRTYEGQRKAVVRPLDPKGQMSWHPLGLKTGRAGGDASAWGQLGQLVNMPECARMHQ